MADERTPVGQTAPRFFRSRVRTPDPEVEADETAAAAHGYVPPEPPPGTDPRLWCHIHHRAMLITRPPERRLHCPHCLPHYQQAGANGGRVSIRTGLRCGRVKCFQIAHYDLWGVPVCSPKCVDLIGQGAGVRPLGCVLRVVAVPAETGGRWNVIAFYPSGRQTGAFERRTIRIHWWVPNRYFPGSTLLRMPDEHVVATRRKVRTGSERGIVDSLWDDDVCGYFLARLARSQQTTTRTQAFGPLGRVLADWRQGLVPRPWIDTTLEPAIRHAERILARVPALRRNRPRRFHHADVYRPTIKPAEDGEQHGVGSAVMPAQLWGVLRGKALRRDAQRRRLAFAQQAKRAAPAQRLDDHERQRHGNDESPPEPEADAG
jgi:hypothetical protein